jgi:hypothetical protein
MSEKDYKNASLHMGKHFLKYLNNILISQEWDDEFLHYKLKKKNGSESFTINLNSLEKTIYSENKTLALKRSKFSKKNSYEILSPNRELAAYIDNFNLWVRNTKTDKRFQLTFDGFNNYGYATNNAGWKKSKSPVLKWSPDSKKIATFRQDAREWVRCI